MQGISEMKRDIYSLKATNQARRQDFIALNEIATVTSQNLDNVSTVLKSNVQNGKKYVGMQIGVNTKFVM